VAIKSPIVWDMTPCSPVKANRRFGGTYRLRLQRRRVSQARNKHKLGRNFIDTGSKAWLIKFPFMQGIQQVNVLVTLSITYIHIVLSLNLGQGPDFHSCYFLSISRQVPE
jgi:hypothetical protein